MSHVITHSVGRDGVNRADDVRIVQTLINRHIQPPRQPLKVDGVAGPNTVAAIEAFQQQMLDALRLTRPTGRVEPDNHTLAALAGKPAAIAAATPSRPAPLDLPASGGVQLTEVDFLRAAQALNCEVACIKAVSEVEAANGGFYKGSQRPKMTFEAPIFSKCTDHRYDASDPDISSPKPNPTLYKDGEAEYERLEKAMKLAREAALKAAVWGRFRLLGLHHRLAGFDSVDDLVAAMFESEGRQLDAFVNFLKNRKLAKPLREKRWTDFARGYNGAHYADNRYDAKLRLAYEEYCK